MKVGLSKGFLVALAFLLPLVYQVSNASADSISVFPGSIQLTDALRGRDYTRMIGIQNGNDSEKTYLLRGDGPVASWISYQDAKDKTPLESIVVPAHSQQQVVLKISVPATIANGDYQGFALVGEQIIDPKKPKDSEATVGLAAAVLLDFNVTGTQKIQGALNDLVILDSEVGIPLTMMATIKNDGNVEVTPAIHFVVFNERNQTVEDKVFTDDPVQPGELRQIVNRWDTGNALPGKQTARVTIDFAGVDLGTRTIPFTLFQRGTMTRSGRLENLRLLTTPQAGGAVKIGATIVNSGAIESRATFAGELYKGSSLLKAVNSPEVQVAVGQRRELELVIDIPSNGSYRLVGKMNFEGKDSDPQELTFLVGKPTSGTSPYIYGMVAALLATVLLLLALLRRRWAGGGGFGGRQPASRGPKGGNEPPAGPSPSDPLPSPATGMAKEQAAFRETNDPAPLAPSSNLRASRRVTRGRVRSKRSSRD